MKQTLKQEMLEKRDSLSPSEIKMKSDAIKNSLYSLPAFKEAKNILFYVSIGSEVYTHSIIKELLQGKEKAVVVPYVESKNPILQLSKLNNFNELEAKTFGILEPKDIYLRRFVPENIDLIIVAAIAFDKYGHRIGYGHGYYDRFLSSLKKPVKKVGLAYELQIVDKIPNERHDVPVDVIVTEKRVMICK